MNEADEAKVEKERFCLETRLVWFGRRGARCAESCESLFRVAFRPSSLLTCRHFSAMIWGLAFILHTLFVLWSALPPTVVWLSLLIALGWPHLTCTCTYCQDSLL